MPTAKPLTTVTPCSASSRHSFSVKVSPGMEANRDPTTATETKSRDSSAPLTKSTAGGSLTAARFAG